MKAIIHIIIVVFLTLLTQIGGVIWILNFGLFKWIRKKKSKLVKLTSFALLYVSATLLIVPLIARIAGRVPLPVTKSQNLIPHNYITPLLNRHYVKPKLRTQLFEIANSVHQGNSRLKVSYLDANFPFIDGFPLLPHLSHDDGKKVDLSFYYIYKGWECNLKPTTSGYGKFVEPLNSEINTTRDCKSKGYWQYDYSKFLTFGSRDDLEFDPGNTKILVEKIAQHNLTEKIFIEPHLKRGLDLSSDKVRFQGCRSVRHDDHIHYQIK